MLEWLFTLLPVLVLGVVFVVALRLIRPWKERQMAKNGLLEWARTARTLSWRDRWRLFRANTAGRAVADPRLATLAVQRGERVLVAAEKQMREGLPRWIWIMNVVTNTGVGITFGVLWWLDGQLFNLALGIFFLLLVLLWLLQPRLDRRDSLGQLPRLRRSIEANRRLAEGPG